MNGLCPCPGAETYCPSGCVNLTRDPDNCGGCAVACPSATPICAASTCVECTRDHHCETDNACSSDTCVANVCVHSQIICDDNDPCSVDNCDPRVGCGAEPVPDGEAGGCTDGKVCCSGQGWTTLGTESDCTVCGQSCSGGTPRCLSGVGCVECLSEDDCADGGNACTPAPTCQGNACVVGAPVVCTALSSCHEVGVCDTATGVCSNPQKAENAACTNAAGAAGTCQSGQCVTPEQGTCAAGASSCDPSTGIILCNERTDCGCYPTLSHGTVCGDLAATTCQSCSSDAQCPEGWFCSRGGVACGCTGFGGTLCVKLCAA